MNTSIGMLLITAVVLCFLGLYTDAKTQTQKWTAAIGLVISSFAFGLLAGMILARLVLT